ncbi:MAG: tyrosine-type recombinase/integrase [Gammaproteobacteria bacterium]|nr:tyrosine-type recombinase/integrase [Gammaproteobacteria bacterium]
MTAERTPVPLGTQHLTQPTEHLIRAATRPNTKRAYQTATRQFEAWAGNRELNDPLVAEYLAHLHHGRGLAPATIGIALSAIKRLAKVAGLETSWKYTSETIAGIRREGRERGRGQSSGLTYEDFITLLNTCDRPRKLTKYRESAHRAKERALVDKVIVSLLFMAGMRRSEVAALQWRDIEDRSQGQLLVQVRSSKTNQEGRPDYRLLKKQAAKAVKTLRAAMQPQDEDRVVPFTCRQIASRFQACCEHSGLEGKFTAHSGRIGLASELITRGASTADVAHAGGWQSEIMVLHYSQQARVEQGAVAKYF